jgi:hypothetical protein
MKYSIIRIARLSAIILLTLLTGTAGAQSTRISVQGILKKGNGNAVADGYYPLTFRVYNTEQGGAAIWTEVQPDVELAGGIYNVLLGSVTPINLPFDATYYLSVQVDNTPEIATRQQLTVAPYALSLKGTGNIFPSSGTVGIGTNSPASGYSLHVVNVSGEGKLLAEGATGSELHFTKGAVTATAGIGSSNNNFVIDPGASNTKLQYNNQDRLEIKSDGISITGSGTFSSGITSSGSSVFNNITVSGNNVNCTANIDLKHNGSTKLVIDNEGIASAAHLEITGSRTISGQNDLAVYRRDGNSYSDVCLDNVTGNYGLKCDNRVRASEFNAFSDRRIKKDIRLSDSREDLEILRRLRVTNYRHVDEVRMGAEFKKGFIAQEVEEVFPEAVSRSTGFIPDVYQRASSTGLSGTELDVTLPQSHGLAVGDHIQVLGPGGDQVCEVSGVGDSHRITISNWRADNPEWLFIYGKQVRDFLQVDYDRIHTLNVSVTQEMIRRVEALEQEINQVQRENEAIRELRDRMEAQVKKMEAALSN